MCGIFGMMLKSSCPISAAQRGVLTYVLANENDERGGDSWGFAAVNEDGRILVKHGMLDLGPNVSELLEYDCFMAHTRWATKGKKVKTNSHPFIVGNIIGAHNGCIWNHDELNTKYGRQCEVDSMHLMHHLDEGHAFDDVEGYGVLEWFEGNDASAIYLCQMSKSGELAVYGIGPDHEHVEGVVWSSDEDHLTAALEIAGIKSYFRYEVHAEQVYYARPDGLYFVKRRKLQLSEDSDFGNWRKQPSYSTSIVKSERMGGWVNRPTNLTDEEWEEWKFLHGIDDEDEDMDVHPEVRALDEQFAQQFADSEEGDTSDIFDCRREAGTGGYSRVEINIETETDDGEDDDLKKWVNAQKILKQEELRFKKLNTAGKKTDQQKIEQDQKLAALLDSFAGVGG